MNFLEILSILKQMGMKYIYFRLGFEIQKRSGILKLRFPLEIKFNQHTDLRKWLKDLKFIKNDGISISKGIFWQDNSLAEEVNEVKDEIFTFFSHEKISMKNLGWHTNPINKYTFPKNLHWSKINDYSIEQGDIKFVWEKNRFSFLYPLIRYNQSTEKDQSKFVFEQIEDWIENNPLNQGPNYKCSQEISLRVLNWIFALSYYRSSENLTDSLLNKIVDSIYGQIRHVYSNINFSRIAVRNNHAITETLTLYLIGLLFPYFPESKKWKRKGKKWFQEEIAYQIYEDGTYLQFSNNYHRVVVQLLTWAIKIAELNNERFVPKVYQRAEKSLEFLYNSMDLDSGYLPNYGSNDGALFFKLNNNDYRDYRPQLQSLACILGKENEYDFGDFHAEDLFWYGIRPIDMKVNIDQIKSTIHSYPLGGFYIAKDADSMTYIRCGNHKDRPAQADNLHIDIWYKGNNIFRDGGTYKYNTEPELLNYFMGTGSHNSVMLDNNNQMLKGPRFVWYNWTQAEYADINEYEDRIEFDGIISAFTFIKPGIKHKRKFIKYKNRAEWIIEDEIIGLNNDLSLNQIWHPNPAFIDRIKIFSTLDNDEPITPIIKDGWHSSYYGAKEPEKYIVISAKQNKIRTKILFEE
jgi:hypothetical protein